MKVNKIILSLIVCFSFHFAKAQLKDTYEKGTIITNEDVRIDGYIKSNDLSHLASEINFKQTEQDEKYITYNTTQIKSFQTTTGKFFELFSIKINNNSTEITVFASLILKGEISLYKTMYKSRIFYIVATKNKNYVLQNDEFISGETEIQKYYYEGILNIATEGLSMEKYPKVAFKESEFVKIISEYNSSKGYESKKVSNTEKSICHAIVFIGGGGKKDEFESFFQALYRIYYPEISRSTSLNLGLQYYNYQYYNYQFSELYNNNTRRVKKTLISIPLQFQQNILQKNIRPYVFGGLNLCYLKVVDNKNNALIENGFQKSFGVGFIYGVGLEIDIYKKIMLKSELRNEIFNHLILFGVGYNFSK